MDDGRHNRRGAHVAPEVSIGVTDRPNAETLVGRRGFLYGAAAVGALAVVGIGTTVANTLPDSGNDVDHLDVPETSLTTLAEFEVIDDAESMVQLMSTFELPYGTLVWANDEKVAACLLPTEAGSPLSMVGILHLGSGMLSTVLQQAVGAAESFEIYDVRATSSGLIWTEANVLQGTWRVYAAKLVSDVPTDIVLLEEGDDTYETPTLAAVNKRAFWQVVPKLPNTDGLPSRLMRATFGKEGGTCVYESARRMCTPPYSATDSVVISPRLDMSSLYYQLTNISSKTGEVLDQLTLPHSIVPLEAGYGTNGFMFSFPDIYNYEGAISNLGTYTPMEKPESSNYSDVQWFGFARTPTAPPAWCDDLLIVKSSYSVCGVDLSDGSYFAIDVDDGADTYGDYLATTGVRETFVTYANIDHNPVEGSATHACRVKVWKPYSKKERKARLAEAAKEEDDETVSA